jgi:alpha-glucosidase
MDDSWLWWRDGIIYQIYPRSFADSDQDGLGDLSGICNRLDYLSDLGVDAIWLSPIYPSPDVDFGYDVSNYTAVDPRFGTLEDFEVLVTEAHRRGIRVVMDMVLNHTSDQHSWFQASRQSRQDPKRDWYLWRDPAPGGGPPNNWQSVFGGSAWEFDPASGQYYYHMFYKEQPDLNWRNEEVRQAIMQVFRFWADRGVDGFRLDVFNVFYKHAEFPSNPAKLGIRGFDRQQHLYDVDQPEMMGFCRDLRSLLDSYKERYAVGETFLSSPEKAALYTGPELLHAAFDFTFLENRWHPQGFLNSIQRWENAVPDDSWPTYVLGNHDVRRIATRYGRGESDERLKVAAAMLLTLRGTPFVYYGDEIGMRDIPIRRSQILDPIGKRYWPFYAGRDGCRAPMQWDASTHAGFSSRQPWLPVHENYSFRNVAEQLADPHSLFNFYRRLIALRRELPVLRQGMFMPITYGPQSILAYLRKTPDDTVLVALNFSRRPLRLALGNELARSNWQLLLSSRRDQIDPVRAGLLSLQGEEAVILRQT